MITAPDDPATFRRYLLGEATEEETEAIERSFLAQDDLIETIGSGPDLETILQGIVLLLTEATACHACLICF